MQRRIAAWTSVLALLAMPAIAGTFLHMSPDQMVSQADAVVQGRVIELNSFWSESGRIIVTEAIVAVEEALLGEVPPLVTVRTFGGQVGDIKVEAPGFPRFESQERVILFLDREPSDGSLRVLGYQEGQFRVVTRRDGVTLAVPMVDEGARYMTRGGAVAPPAVSLELGDFKARLQQTAAKVGRGGAAER